MPCRYACFDALQLCMKGLQMQTVLRVIDPLTMHDNQA